MFNYQYFSIQWFQDGFFGPYKPKKKRRPAGMSYAQALAATLAYRAAHPEETPRRKKRRTRRVKMIERMAILGFSSFDPMIL